MHFLLLKINLLRGRIYVQGTPWVPHRFPSSAAVSQMLSAGAAGCSQLPPSREPTSEADRCHLTWAAKTLPRLAHTMTDRRWDTKVCLPRLKGGKLPWG